MQEDIVLHLPDTQNKPDSRGIKINKVGISGLSLPVTLSIDPASHTTFQASATFSCYVSLDASKKGINMSRLPQTIQEFFLRRAIDLRSLQEAVKTVATRSESEEAFLKVAARIFLEKKAPVSKLASLSPYDIVFEVHSSGKVYVTTVVTYISTCPCSKELSLALEKQGKRGAPHMQRSFAAVTVEPADVSSFSIAELIQRVEDAVVTVPYTLIKRPDEQHVANQTWENPQFSEDAVRNIASVLEKWSAVSDYVIVVEHQESIHFHNAVAIVNKGKTLK